MYAAQPFAGADSRFSRVCRGLSCVRRGKRAAQLKAVGQRYEVLVNKMQRSTRVANRFRNALCVLLLGLLTTACQKEIQSLTTVPIPSSSPTTQPVFPTKTPTIMPSPTADYVMLPSFQDIMLLPSDWQIAERYDLPFFSEPGDEISSDRTFEISEFCVLDCIRIQWIAESGGSLTLTAARFPSQDGSFQFLDDEHRRFNDRFSDALIACEDPYEGKNDISWLCQAYGGATQVYAITRDSIFISVEWSIVPQGLDIEFGPGDIQRIADAQLRKFDIALGVLDPPPSPTPQEL
jgi:hypothetical protein